MRWPNRRPHSLTAGMRLAQQALTRFLPLISWQHFRRINMNQEIILAETGFSAFGCADEEQAVLWLLRTNTLNKKGMIDQAAEKSPVSAQVPGLKGGRYLVTTWNTREGIVEGTAEINHSGAGNLQLPKFEIVSDLAIAITRTGS